MSAVSLWYLIPLTVASLLGILINAYILLVVLFARQLTSVNNLLLLHLGTLNLSLGATFLVFSAPGLVHDSWLSHGSLCYLHGFLFTTLHPVILWTICGLNTDRYYAIAAPLHYGHLVNPRRVLLCLGIGWTISLFFTIFPFLHVAPFMFNRGLGACVPNFQSGRTNLWYSAAYTAFTLLLPITLIICCNVKILLIARYHRHRIASAIYEVTLSAQVTITHQRNPFIVPTITGTASSVPKFRSRSPISTVLQLLGSIVILYVPYYSIILWESCVTFLEPETNAVDHEVLYEFVLALLTLTPAINGFLYGVKNKNVRKTFQSYWRKKLMKSEVNQEIQARTPSTCGSRRQSLTPLGFFARPNPTRRLSEVLLDSHKDDTYDDKSRIKRIASEFTWRPKIQTDILMDTKCTLQVPTLNISECNLEQELGKLHPVVGANAEAFQLTSKSQEGIKNQFVLPLRENLPDQTDKFEASRTRKKSFLFNLFGQNHKAPKVLITRALSEEDYSKNIRKPSKNSLSKWYHSDYNLINDHVEETLDVKTKLLAEHRYNEEEWTCNHFDGPGRNHWLYNENREDHSSQMGSDESSINSGYSSGLYMTLDSFDILRTHSCDIENEFANSSFEAEESRVDRERNAQKNVACSTKTCDLVETKECHIEIGEQQQEVVL